LPGDDHHVTGVVGVEIHDDIRMPGAMQNQMLDIVTSVWFGAENTRRVARLSTDIAHAPWCPESFHFSGTLCHQVRRHVLTILAQRYLRFLTRKSLNQLADPFDGIHV
jgi:hypothetical protein